MIAVIQRVSQGKVTINNKTLSEIKAGYVILVGIFEKDTQKDINKLVDKITHLRIFSDRQNRMNKSILDTDGKILIIPQFTLCANLKGGRRPDFFPAMKPTKAKKFFDIFVDQLKKNRLVVKTGKFGAMMNVAIFNDGPVTFILDSNKL